MADDWPGDMPDEFRKGAAFAERIAADEIAALRARVAELEAALRGLVEHVERIAYRYTAGLRLGPVVPQFENARRALGDGR